MRMRSYVVSNQTELIEESVCNCRDLFGDYRKLTRMGTPSQLQS